MKNLLSSEMTNEMPSMTHVTPITMNKRKQSVKLKFREEKMQSEATVSSIEINNREDKNFEDSTTIFYHLNFFLNKTKRFCTILPFLQNCLIFLRKKILIVKMIGFPFSSQIQLYNAHHPCLSHPILRLWGHNFTRKNVAIAAKIHN